MKTEPEKSKPTPAGGSLAEWRWPIVVLGVMVLIAFLQSIETAKDTTKVTKDAVDTARHISETVREVTEAAVTIAENFTHAKITETFVESLPEVKDAGEGRLEVATMKNVKTFKRTDRLTILWDTVSLGTTVTEIKVPATYRYHIRLSEPWKLEVQEQNCDRHRVDAASHHAGGHSHPRDGKAIRRRMGALQC